MAKREKRIRKSGSTGRNRNISENFLKKNNLKEEVITTKSGLQYQVIEQTDREKASDDNTLEIHQRALLLNGTILIDTYRENRTSIVEVHELIEGLQEGLLLMPRGSRFKFWVPPELAWGKKGSGSTIPPNAVLVFDVRLVDFF